MGSLADRLNQPTARETEFRPRTEFDGRAGFIQTQGFKAADAPKSHEEILRAFGYDPAEVRIAGNPRVSRWQVYGGEWLEAYKFHLEPVHDSNLDELFGLIKRHRAHKPVGGGSSVFNVMAGDVQLGKVDAGGSEGIVQRYLDSMDVAVAEFKRLRKLRNVGPIQLVFPGDLCEGNQSQGGRTFWRTDLTITEQVRVFRRLLLHTVELFAPLTDELLVRVVGGNHDQAQRFQDTKPGDNHATEAAIAVSDAISLNSDAYGHVKVEIPRDDRSHMTVAAGDSVFTVVHGNQWNRGGAMKWWQGHAFNGGNPGASQFLLHGHWHAFEVETTANRTRICGATFEGASDWFEERTGGTARKGAVVFTSRGGEFADLSLV